MPFGNVFVEAADLQPGDALEGYGIPLPRVEKVTRLNGAMFAAPVVHVAFVGGAVKQFPPACRLNVWR